ncbi:chromosome segregation protein sudA (DA-box protein sudA) [Mycotypha africana]|uniref:chromosome segregation protein sudA (DA-box protein sudA) n=1 Tax=Mycotypha africana TaxID=64632 RepID=UPI00230017BD|nr:chromosome segregation protein sudA (DA-box protein sudA) [Mycotypha africana]KAI8984689.1 chromosome segregation protein sudA (DA-box protein sudA) [Mycotypha africana]
MYIKQVIIKGFKSYKDQQVIDPFSPKHNVIVGRNGSGKSNFFAAIRFVLGDAYQNLSKEERQALLHEGVGAATISAFVEIIFDNSDNRFPTGKDEVVLRRSIGLTMDDYTLDRKAITKSEVASLLESAGFSKANPYYIVPQGRITSLTTAKDEDRLKILKEIAGTRVYEDKRAESNKLMQETHFKKTKIDEVLSYIQDRLQELEAEKAELSEFQELDKERRTIEYTIYAREQASANRRLDDLEEERRRHINSSESLRDSYLKNEETVQQQKTKLRDIQQSIQLYESEKKDFQDERETLMKERAQLELLIKDLEDSQMSEEEFKSKMESEIRAMDEQINTQQATLAQIKPQYDEYVQQEQQYRLQLRILQAEQHHIHAKQARASKFTSQSERDTWLNRQIQDITHNLTIRQNQLRQLEAEKQQIEQDVAKKTKEAQQLKEAHRQQFEERERLANEELQLKLQRDEAMEERKQLWREEAKMEAVVRNCRDEIRKAERTLANAMDKNISTGLAAIHRIVKEQGLTGVYGPIFELLQVAPELETAVEVAVGASLFHVVVDTDETATQLLEIMNHEKSGRITFIPLNRVKPRSQQQRQQEDSFDREDAVPLISQVSFDPQFQLAFEQVFGGIILCRTLEVATTYAKTYHLTVVTAEGNRVDGRGAMSGGYIDTKRSRLSAAKKLRTWQAQLEEELLRGKDIKQNLLQLDQKVTQIVSQLRMLEAKKKKLQLNQAVDDVQLAEAKLRKEEDLLKSSLLQKTRALDNIRVHGQLLEKQLISYQNELQSELIQSLTSEEQEILQRNTTAIEEIRQKTAETKKMKDQLEERMNKLKDTLENQLLRKKEDLLNKKDRVITRGSLNDLNRSKNELKAITKKLVRLSKRIGDLDNETDRLQEEDANITSGLEQAVEVQMKITQAIQREEKRLEENLLKRSLLTQKKEECNANIRDLGVLPDEAFEKYSQTYRIEKLLRKLHRVNERLKKYNHVNKKAFEQYGRFTKQQEQLNKRKEELDTSEDKIRGLIDNLDRRKNEAIKRTFHDLSIKFAEIFEQLVPDGKGELVMKSDSTTIQSMDLDNSSSSSQSIHSNSAAERYSGISIKVSFNSKSDEGLIMQQLSGGQKSLVALALIFAIQKCDPAPFYLFDEIDANLDAQYRTAVADMIHKMSNDAQFITTTFRPELIQNADKFYGVTFHAKVSRFHDIEKENAMAFIEHEQLH